MTDLSEILNNHIYPNIDLVDALIDLDPTSRGDYFVLKCPQCGKKRAFIYKGRNHITCNRRDSCAFTQSLWDYLKVSRGLQTNQDVLKELARLAGYTLPDLKGYSFEKVEKAKVKTDLLEAALTYFKTRLWDSGAKPVLDYYRSRGYTDEEIENMDIGFYPTLSMLLIHLREQGHEEKNIREAGLMTPGFGETHQAVIGYRSPSGTLKGYAVRSMLPESELKEKGVQKYKYSYGLTLDSLFNLHTAKRKKNIVAAESFLDALIATERGIEGVTASGTSSLTEKQIENACRYGVKGFILSLDNGPAGEKGTEKTIERLASRGLKSFVVELDEKYKDPGDLIRDEGIEPYKQAIDDAEKGVLWYARRLLKRHNLDQDTDRQAAVDEAVEFSETILDPLDSKDFEAAMAAGLDVDPDTLKSMIQDYKDKKAQKRVVLGYREMLRESTRLLDEGKVTELKDYIEEKAASLRVKSVSRTIRPYTLADLMVDTLSEKPGLKTGYKELDKLITIPPGAITLVAGRPSHGKTTLMMNMLLRMVEKYPDQAFYFFSYEESKYKLSQKLINTLSGETIHASDNLRQIDLYLRNGETNLPKIEEGKKKFQTYAESQRLWLIDEQYAVDNLIDTIEYLNSQRPTGAVFIDYAQRVRPSGYYKDRYVAIKLISEKILETAKNLSIPAIMGAQLGRDKEHKDKVRLDNLRESGDLEQDANIVIGLFNPAMQKAQDEGDKCYDTRVELELTILKNRDGQVNDRVSLDFERPILTIRDKQRQ